MELSFIQALLLGGYYWFSLCSLGYGVGWGTALTVSAVTGIILGDPVAGAKCGAVIQPMFLAFTGAGGTVVWDQRAGSMVGTTITIIAGLPLDQALTVALPVSLLFAQLHTIRRIWFATPAMLADKAALECKDRAIIFYGSWFCALSKFVIFAVPMTVALMAGAEAVGNVLQNLPAWLVNALSAVGGILPSLGFAMTIRVIGRPQFLPYFLGGYFLVEYTGIGGLFLAFIGLFFAFQYYLMLSQREPEEEQQQIQAEEKAEEGGRRLLDIKDCRRMATRWWWFCEQSNSFARLQSIAFCVAFIPALKKLYGDDPEEYSAALQRHLMFFNTQGIWGSIIHGIVLAMEEQRALGAPIEVDAITGIKAGLMGPFAGIGDTIDWATIRPLLQILFLPLAASGNLIGSFAPAVLLFLITFTELHIYTGLGFNMGTRAALTVLQGRAINTFISCASVLGLFMMGGLAAALVKCVTPLYIPTSGSPALVQSGILDKIAPGILPLVFVLGTYKFIMSGNSMTKATLLLTALGLTLGIIGIIGNGGLIFQAYVAPAA